MLKKILTAFLIAAALSPGYVGASTGCTYPASHDSWTNKIAGDFLTIADVNQFRCAVEKLETGPVRPLDGLVTAPAFAFRDDPDTGMYRGGTNILDFATAGTYRARFDASGRFMIGTADGTGSNGGDIVIATGKALRFLSAINNSSANFTVIGTTDDDMVFGVPLGTDQFLWNWAGTTAVRFQRQAQSGGIHLFGEGSASDHAAPSANSLVLYPRVTGGKVSFMVRFPNGTTEALATEP